MHPALLHLGPATLYSYGVCVILALGASIGAVMLVARLMPKSGALIEHVAVFACCAPVVAALGARAEYVLFRFRDYTEGGGLSLGAILTRGGLWWWGAVLACAAAFVLYALVRKLALGDALAVADVAVIGFPVAQAVGKLGCLLAGCCYGKPAFHVDAVGAVVADFPGAMRFPAESLAFFGLQHESTGVVDAATVVRMKEMHETVPLIPAQLLEMIAAAAVALGLVLLWRARRDKRPGAVVVAYGVALSLCAFAADCLRADVAPLAGPLTVAQAIAILVFAASACVGLLSVRVARRRAPESASAAP